MRNLESQVKKDIAFGGFFLLVSILLLITMENRKEKPKVKTSPVKQELPNELVNLTKRFQGQRMSEGDWLAVQSHILSNDSTAQTLNLTCLV
jgi:hypothetical protein